MTDDGPCSLIASTPAPMFLNNSQAQSEKAQIKLIGTSLRQPDLWEVSFYRVKGAIDS